MVAVVVEKRKRNVYLWIGFFGWKSGIEGSSRLYLDVKFKNGCNR